jgi:cell division protein FtsN
MMDDYPEKAASAKREEKRERKQPGVAKLMRIYDRANGTQHERNHGNHSEQERKPSKSAALEILAFGRWGSL